MKNSFKIIILKILFYNKNKKTLDLSGLDFGKIRVSFNNVKANYIDNGEQQAEYINNQEQKGVGIWNGKQKATYIDNLFQKADYIDNRWQVWYKSHKCLLCDEVISKPTSWFDKFCEPWCKRMESGYVDNNE